MALMPGSTIVYRCSFDIESCNGFSPDESWKAIVKTIRSWVKQAPRSNPPKTNDAFGGGWFYAGGQWQAPAPGFFRVTTAQHVGSGTPNRPDHWAIQYEHGCDNPGRIWRTDISVGAVGECRHRMTVTVSHYMKPGFMPLEDASPSLTVPRIVRTLCESQDWKCFAGSEELTPQVRLLSIGMAPTFKRVITDADRSAPIVYVSRHAATGEPMVDSAAIARGLVGAATVFESESADVDQEIAYMLGDEFACFAGAVRVYYPPVQLDSSRDKYRHRYTPYYEIADKGSDAIQAAIVRMIVTRPGSYSYADIESVQDVERLKRETAAREFAAKVAAATAGEGDLAVYEALLVEADENIRELTDDVRKHIEDAEREREAREESEEDARRQSQEATYWQKRALQAEASERSQRLTTDAVIDCLVALPTSPADVLAALEGLFPDRLAFTDRGRKSLLDSPAEVGVLWTGLFHMATTLHDALFNDGAIGSLRDRFESSSGLELAETEKRLTNKDNKLTALRVDEFRGDTIDVTPHVKFDKSATRGYFDKWDRDGERLVVVGYVGHLKTAGTRKIS